MNHNGNNSSVQSAGNQEDSFPNDYYQKENVDDSSSLLLLDSNRLFNYSLFKP